MTFSDIPTSSDASPVVLWIETNEAAEFSAARAILRSTGCLWDPRSAETHPTAVAGTPHWGVVATTRDGEFTLGDWHHWKVQYRLCRWVMLCGPWCRGRTRPPEFATRLAWHEFPAWWGGQLPLGSESTASRRLVAGIVTAHRAQAEMYEPFLRAAGISPEWVDPSVRPDRPGPYDLYVWDAASYGRCRPMVWEDLQRLAAGRPVMVIAPALRPDDAARWPGGACYISYPFGSELLFNELRRIVASIGTPSSLGLWRLAG